MTSSDPPRSSAPDRPGPPEDPSGADAGIESAVAGLLGIVRGVLADGVVNEAEALALRDWISWHPEAATRWPVKTVARRLEEIFRDGRVDAEERADLAELLRRLLDGSPGPPLRVATPRDLPLDEPPPPLTFPGRVFVFLGRFASGSAAFRARRTLDLGALIEHDVTRRTDVIVVGAFTGVGDEESGVAERLREALALRQAEPRPVIVAEEHWMACLPTGGLHRAGHL